MRTTSKAILLTTLLAAIVALNFGAAHSQSPAAPAVRALALPGAPETGASMDYTAYDAIHHRVWVPAGNTGSVYVIDTTNDQATRIAGFQTAEVEMRGQKRTVGPSSATVGDGVVYIGNRADASVCAVDAVSLKIGGCAKLDSSPDGLAYVAATKEVWVTTPRDKSIVVLDAAALAVKAKLRLDGAPEGYAVDNQRGIFYTNLEDKDRTLTIDLRSRAVARTWMPNCGEKGPRGLALDGARNFLFVACTDHVVALDAGHDGKLLSQIDTGDGVDNIDYVEPRAELFAAAGRAGKLTIAHVDQKGALTPAAVVTTAVGARNAVATERGAAYLIDPQRGRVLAVGPTALH